MTTSIMKETGMGLEQEETTRLACIILEMNTVGGGGVISQDYTDSWKPN